MNESEPDFEQFLKRRRVPVAPGQWRCGILAAAHAAEKVEGKHMPGRPWWIAWLWPSPYAWAGIGCAWALALGMNAMSSLPDGGTPAITMTPQSTPVYTMMMGDRWLTWELFQEEREPAVPPPPRRDPSGAWNGRRKQPQTITA
jgi:hypothetical protein